MSEPSDITSLSDEDEPPDSGGRRRSAFARLRAVPANAWFDGFLLVVFVIGMALLLTRPETGLRRLPALDSIAATTVRAQRGLLVEDQRATELRRAAAVADAPVVFNHDNELYFALGERVRRAVGELRRRMAADQPDAAQRRTAFEADLGISVSAGVFELIEKLPDPDDVALAITYFLNIALDRLVIDDRAALPRERPVEIRDTAIGSLRTLRSSYAVLDLRGLRRLMTAKAGDASYGEARIVRSWILDAARRLAVANLSHNRSASEEHRNAAAAVPAVFVRIAAGEVLLRRGDRVTKHALDQLRLLRKSQREHPRWAEPLAIGVLVVGILALGYAFFRRGRIALKFGRKRSYLTLTAVAITAVLSVLAYYAGLGLAEVLGFNPEGAGYLAPLALATVLIALLVDARTSLLAGIALTLFVTFRVDGDLWLVTYYIVGVLVAGISARTSRRRSDLLRIGMAVAVAQAMVVPIIIILAGQSFATMLLPMLAASFVSGALVAIAALGLLPLLEQWFDEATDLKLLELVASDNPVLRELALTAPGSYHHSVMVANLAEAAADSVGANGLRCRVMALYHDIGKIKRPNYFSENQRSGENLHDLLLPEDSARIVFAHVSDGAEMARRHRLGRAVVDGIMQHHGTSLLRTFHEKALLGPSGNQVVEADFRYDGPKPKSREAGILMLADSTEASTRALKDPSPADLKQRIVSVFETLIRDGQLDACELTMRDVARVEDSFVRVLTLGVYHNRIEYPSAARDAAKAGGAAATEEGRGAGAGRVGIMRSLVDRSSRG